VADLVVFVCLVGLIGAAGITLGMLAARRLDAWDERRAAADAAPAVPGPGSAGGREPVEERGDTVD